MSVPKYLKQVNNGNTLINLKQLPDSVFVNAVKVVDICSAKLMTRAERRALEPGSPDVLIRSLSSGKTAVISRQALVNTFMTAKGAPIKVAFLRSKKEYPVMRGCSEQFKILHLPMNCIGFLDGTKVAPGSYVVCPLDQNGLADKSQMSVIADSVFKKMFKVPMQSIIKKHLNGNKNNALSYDKIARTQNELNRTRHRGNLRRDTRAINNPFMSPAMAAMNNNTSAGVGMGMGGSGAAFGNGAMGMGSNAQGTGMDTPFKSTQPAQPRQNIQPAQSGRVNQPARQPVKSSLAQAQNKQRALMQQQADQKHRQSTAQAVDGTPAVYRFRATKRIVNMNNKQLLGFVILEIASGKEKPMELSKVRVMADKRLIENLSLVQKEGTTVKFLRGNGIRIESLPEVIK